MARTNQSDQRGFALLMALLLALAVTAMAIGAILMSSNATLISRFHAKELEMQSAADMGLEVARDTINGGLALPDAGFDTLELNRTVRDATGAVIPGFTRSVYAGKTGSTTGQFGVFASVLSVISDTRGAVVVRRAELSQESFSKFARFDDRTTSSVVFANGIQVFGPLHTNGILYVSSSGSMPTFWGPVTTASTINSVSNGNFRQGYKQNQPVIPMPTPANLADLATYAAAGNTTVPGGAVGTSVYDPSVRIEFIPVDIDGDGQFTGANEGFMRVYQALGATPTAQAKAYVTARLWNTGSSADPNAQSPNCGSSLSGAWQSAQAVNPTGANLAGAQNLLNHASRRCYLGGDPRLTGGFVAVTPAPANYGQWLPWPGYGAGAAPPAIANGRLPDGTIVGAVQARYLWPVNRPFNPAFKGVVYVNGSVGVSGLARGQVTVATTGNIMLSDDITYVTAPGSSVDCTADILGLLTPQYFMLEDNNVNSPFRVNNTYRTGYDDTADEFLHAAVLTLNSIQTENVSGGSTNSETCVGSPVGRGCFNMVGAAIQGINGSRMSSSGTGWNPQWSYDRCDGLRPPPYFPTTGRYYKNRYYEIDPVGFSVTAWFAANAS
jgi:Tfp pilus assembly protein PilX